MNYRISISQDVIECFRLQTVPGDHLNILRHLAFFSLAELATSAHAEHLDGWVLLGHRFEDVITHVAACAGNEHFIHLCH